MSSNLSSLTSERIVNAASKLFAANGYHATSTRNIARLADISESTLFRHFRCKEEIFWAALRDMAVENETRSRALRKLEQGEPPEEVLPSLFVFSDQMVNAKPEFTRLLAIGFVELRINADEFMQESLGPIVHALNSYVRRSVRSGYVRDINPVLATTALMSTALLYPAFMRLIGVEGMENQNGERSLDFAKFWLDLVRPLQEQTDWEIPH
jgi:AcrR family transcriptional regulator